MTKEIILPATDNDSVRICIWGDLVQTEDNKIFFENGDIKSLLGDGILQELSETDVVIFNLEAPLTANKTPIHKPQAPCIASSPKCINSFNAIQSLGCKMVASCANNHIKDFNIEGITETIKLLSDNNIGYVGVSNKNIKEAKQPVIISRNGQWRIGIYSCAENEFSIADDKNGGANGYDPLTTFDDIRELKDKCDRVIVLFHAGRENYKYPSPQLQRICRKMINAGADVIVCQHSHCIGCEEQYKDGHIIYGQGNFIFHRTKNTEWYTGLMISCTVGPNKKIEVAYKAIENHPPFVRLCSDSTQNTLLSAFKYRSSEIQDPLFIQQQWENWVFDNIDVYCMHALLGCQNRYILAIDRRLNYFISKLVLRNKYRRKLLLNYIRCESIREAMTTLLNSNRNE